MSKLFVTSCIIVILLSTSVSCAIEQPSDGKDTSGPIPLHRKLSNCAITGFDLIDTRTSIKVADLVNGTVIDLVHFAGSTPSFNINATFSGSGFGSVVFGRNSNPKVHLEHIAWYSFCGNTGNVFLPCPSLGVGRHTITATPYAERRAGGQAGSAFTVSFKIIDSGRSAPVSVQPALAPTNRPFALRLHQVVALSPTMIDVSTESSIVDLQVKAQDFAEGLSEIFVMASGIDKSYSAESSCYYRYGSVKGPVTCNITLAFPQYIRQGNYTLAVSLESFGGEYILFSSNELARRSFPSVVTVINTEQDIASPKLLDFNLSDSKVVVANKGAARVVITAAAQDDKSGLKSGRIDATRVGSNPAETLIVVGSLIVSKRNPATIRFALAFAWFASPPGNYSLQLHLADVAGNAVSFTSAELARQNLPSHIEIINDHFDGTDPTLLNFTAPTVANVTSGAVDVQMQLLVRDNLSGVTSVSVSIAQEGGTELWAWASMDEPIAAGEAALVELTLTVPQNLAPGRYRFNVFCSDAQDNDVWFDSSALKNASFPYFIDVYSSLTH